jgi:hypothetical protein
MHSLRNARIISGMLAMLLVLLLLAQTLGAMHRVAHAKPMESAASHVVSETSNSIQALWGDHSNGSDCRVFDQTCPDLVEFSNWQIAPSIPSFFWAGALLQARFTLFERFYLAHGPPAALH